MIVLGIDTSTEVLSVALCDYPEPGAISSSVADERRHAEALIPAVASVLEGAGLERTSIEGIGVGRGPGAFTGTRVGVATAKGLAIGLGVPLFGVGSLWTIAQGARRASGLLWEGEIGVVVDAHRGEVYAARYDAEGDASAPPRHLPPEEALAWLLDGASGALVLQGSGVRRYEAVFGSYAGPPERDAPSAAIIAQEAGRRLAAGVRDERVTLEPDYVRASDAVPQQQE